MISTKFGKGNNCISLTDFFVNGEKWTLESASRVFCSKGLVLSLRSRVFTGEGKVISFSMAGFPFLSLKLGRIEACCDVFLISEPDVAEVLEATFLVV